MEKVTWWIVNTAMQTVLWLLRRLDYHFSKSVVHLDPEEALRDPHFMCRTLRKRGHILRSYLNNGWIVSGYEEVTELLREPRVSNDFSDNKFIMRILRLAAGGRRLINFDDPTMLTRNPPDHTRLRKLVAQGFVHKYIQSLAPTIEHLVDEMLDKIPADATHFDVMESLAKPLPAIVIAEMMGVPLNERHMFERWSEALMGGTDLSRPDLIRESADANMEMRAYLAKLTEIKRCNPGQDLISQLIAAEEDGDKLTLDELYSNCILLLVAGHETTTRLVGNCLYLLLVNPGQMDLARESETNLVNALEESLRCEPPVMFTARIVKDPFEYGGSEFKRGQMLLLSIASANRDPAVTEDPDTFDVLREKVTHVSFGYGIHLCLGMSLARLEAKIVLTKLFDRYPNLEYAEKSPSWGTNPMFRGLESLSVRTALVDIQPAPTIASNLRTKKA